MMQIAFKAFLAAGLLVGLGACSLGEAVESDFRTPNEVGEFSTDIDIAQRGSIGTVTEGGVSYVVGGEEGTGFRAFAGVLPQTTYTEVPTSGLVQYSGSYGAVGISSLNTDGVTVNGITFKRDGDITLTANFTGETLTGTSDDGQLVVNGELSGARLTGDVIYSGTRGELKGGIGADKTVGAFQGSDDDRIFAGGFVGEAQ